jgi:transformation/transcription domain-associated protein
MSDKESIQAASGAARVLQIVCADKDDDWYRENGPLLSNLIRKGLVLDLPLSTALLPIFERLCYLFPLRKELEDDDKMSDFHKWIRSTLSENAVIAPQPFLQMLASIGRADQESLGVLTNSILKLVQRFCKEHAEMVDDSPVTPHLITILDLIKTTIAHGGDQKKVLWLCIGYIIERCKNVAVCSHILALARHFALEHSEPFPSQKEKAALLVKFGIWEVFFPEKRPMGPNQAAVDKAKDAAGMFTKYLEVIYEIYMDPALRRSDLTSRLEGPFLVGCRARDPILREKFITLLDANIPRSLFSRLSYIIGSQGWEPLNDHNWSYVASYLLLGAVNIDATISPALISSTSPELGVSQRAESLVDSWRHMLLLDTTLGHDTWVSLFPKVWAHLSRREQVDLTHHMIALLSKDYHHRQAELRPNVIQTLLEGVHRCVPAMILPPHLIKYLAKSYGAWHVALEMLTESLDHLAEEPTGRDIVLDALAELYGELSEEDAFYGLWRRRAIHVETSIGMALEESGMWEQASAAYEHALIKAKSGSLVFTEPEYCLWEDHWILAQEKLQQWDVLYDLGRNESNNAQLLEAAWRSKNWSENREQMEQYVAALPEVATPRRCIYSAFLALLKPTPTAPGENHESSKHVNDCFRLTVHKWKTLPVRMSHAHVPLLQHFQQGIELQEAVQIFNSLATTNAQNLDKKSQDLKLVLQAWRERLPSPYDDISIWSDLVAWRRNVFNAINAVYLPLVQQTGQNGGTAGNTSTLGYRGFHETAWIINRFAHVARKHELLDACHTQLTSIYQLPNIEISEAFLKLREQARCHYLKPDELAAGLEVVNNTNLMYFSPPQKAEFFTLKGMFHSKANRLAEANEAFGQAVQTDMNQAKAWAQWGKYNDRLFKHNKTDFASGANAVSCYLQAAGLYKSGKSRPLLARVLWLLSVDDPTSAISRQFDGFKGDAVYWYWITFIPQLCLAGTYREANPARHILMNIAGLFPQVGLFMV